MTRYFAQNTPRAGLEHMMMSVPGFQKRGGGMMILSRFCYKPEDVDCRYCLHYALGKLYLLGKEVPKDRSSAIKWFQLATDQGNEYAQYFLEHMDDRLGQPPVAAVISLFHHLANIFQEQNQPPPSGGVRVAVDRKLLRKIKAKKIAQGHKADDHEPEMQL